MYRHGDTPPPLLLGVECLKSASEPRIYWGKWTFDGGLAGSRNPQQGTTALHPSTRSACRGPVLVLGSMAEAYVSEH